MYRRHFAVPPELAAHRIFLDFDGAMTAATVTLNGQRLSEHVGGYLPFTFAATDHLVDGPKAPIQSGKEVRAILLPNTGSDPNGRIVAMHVFAIAVGSAEG